MSEPIIQDAEAQVTELNDECERLRASVETWRMMYKADCKPEVIANLSAELAERDETIARLTVHLNRIITFDDDAANEGWELAETVSLMASEARAALAEQPSVSTRREALAELTREAQELGMYDNQPEWPPKRDATITRLISDCLEFVASESTHGPNCRTQRYQYVPCNCGRQDVLTRLSAALAEQPSPEPDPRYATIARLRRELQARIAACETSGCGLTCTTDGCGIADALRGS